MIFQDMQKVVIKQNGINETIFKYVTEEITGNSEIISNMLNSEVQKEMLTGNYNIDY